MKKIKIIQKKSNKLFKHFFVVVKQNMVMAHTMVRYVFFGFWQRLHGIVGRGVESRCTIHTNSSNCLWKFKIQINIRHNEQQQKNKLFSGFFFLSRSLLLQSDRGYG